MRKLVPSEARAPAARNEARLFRDLLSIHPAYRFVNHWIACGGSVAEAGRRRSKPVGIPGQQLQTAIGQSTTR